jgi:hypothetical protein
MQRFERILTIPYQLFRGFNADPVLSTPWTRLEQFRVDFAIDGPATLQWMGKVNLRHRGADVGYTGPIGVAVRATLRCSPAPLPAPPASTVNRVYHDACVPFVTRFGKAAKNIASIDDHYADLTTIGEERLMQVGCYRLEFWGCSHSTGAPQTDGLACVNVNGDGSDAASPYSYVIAKVVPDAG